MDTGHFGIPAPINPKWENPTREEVQKEQQKKMARNKDNQQQNSTR